MAAGESAEYLEDPIKSEIAPPAPSPMDSAESVTLDPSDLRGSINKILMADALALRFHTAA